jgi:hypothetical protein
MAYNSSLISAVYFIDFHIAAIGVDSVWTCETIAPTFNFEDKTIYFCDLERQTRRTRVNGTYYTIHTGIWLGHNAVSTIYNSRTGITIGIDYKLSPADNSGGYAWLGGHR